MNPNYAETILIDFVFESTFYLISVRQKLTFQIYHEANPPQLVGKFETSLGEIFGSPTNGLIRPIKNKEDKEGGKIIIRCEKVETGTKKIFTGKISVFNLPNLSWLWLFGGTYPFFRIFRKRRQDELLIYESEVMQKHELNPSWKQFTIP